jgi:hypothetical protein
VADELGYLFHGKQHPSGLGFLQLTANIYAEPTRQHFDPEQVTVPVITRQGEIDQTTIIHPWYRRRELRLSAGRIILRDRVNKTVQAFSFGGVMEIVVKDARTSCYLRSPAPIFELTELDGLSVMFISKVESLLAKERVTWDCNDMGFEHRLSGTDPETLFVAALAAVVRQIDQLPYEVRNGQYQRNTLALRKAIQNMQADGTWPSPPPSLDNLLACRG